jgi:4-hydroxy-4-methyl-2-oxoglutarate aldolase
MGIVVPGEAFHSAGAREIRPRMAHENGLSCEQMTDRMGVSKADFDAVRDLDTCTVSNAIERLNVRLRNEGFISGALRCRFQSFAPMLGYAVTGRIRSSSPPMAGRCYYDRMDFWDYVTTLPAPRVLVLQDADPRPGFGALVGEIHAAIGVALDCVGCVTNGAVRDLPAVKALGFHLFSGSVSVSHAYAHLIEFGQPVEIGGLKIAPGDLIHGDCHGVHAIPIETMSRIPREAAKILHAEGELKTFCRSSDFSIKELPKALKRATAESL